jgi:hypothetical protein
VKTDLGCSRNATEEDLFQTRLRRGGDRDGVTITTKPGSDQENVDLRDRFWLREFSHGFVGERGYCSTRNGGVVSIVEQSRHICVTERSANLLAKLFEFL